MVSMAPGLLPEWLSCPSLRSIFRDNTESYRPSSRWRLRRFRASKRGHNHAPCCCGYLVSLAYVETVIRGSSLAQDFNSYAALFMLILIAVILNPLLGLLRRYWYLARAEVVLI